MHQLNTHRTLVLNADMQPLSWMPLSTWSWQEAMTAVLQDRVIQLKTYEDLEIHSATQTFEVPAVVCLRQYHKRQNAAFTRYNLFLRDGFRCQYCGAKKPAKDLTFDHVLPRSRKGPATFENIVAACQSCNLRKSNRTPREAGMKLLRKPRAPSPHDLDKVGRKLARVQSELHQTWLDFLYWGADLEA
ncbi:MAG: HNH endonuclease [Rhodobacteraceae bacterium]|nr:HNH endonuclease [Paracoccaceae bacterium]HCW84780.1 HNH endonuclease [Paracoccaceae bacterium]